MGTSLAVTHATIFMIWLETPIVDEFRRHIALYKRYIDDGSDSYTELCYSKPRTDLLRGSINLPLHELRAPEAESNAFPPRAFFTVRSALPMRNILRQWKLYDLNGVARLRPLTRGYSGACCDPSDAELKTDARLAPFGLSLACDRTNSNVGG